MVRPKDLNPDESPRAFYGARLRTAREAAGLSQDKLGERVFCSGAYIAQIETMVRRPQPDLGRLLDRELGTDIFEGLARAIANDSPLEDYFQPAAELESRATEICDYAPVFVPGLLQTPAYARALFEAGNPFDSDDEIEVKLAARLRRAALLNDPVKPKYWVILDESVLQRTIGSPAVMAEQLEHIVELANRRRVGVQVLPLTRGGHGIIGVLMHMSFDDEPDVAYVEAYLTGSLLDTPLQLALAKRRYAWLRSAAMPSDESLALIRTLAEHYGHERTA